MDSSVCPSLLDIFNLVVLHVSGMLKRCGPVDKREYLSKPL